MWKRRTNNNNNNNNNNNIFYYFLIFYFKMFIVSELYFKIFISACKIDIYKANSTFPKTGEGGG